MVKSGLAHGQFAQMVFVFACERRTKVVEGLIGNRENTPRVTARGENASGFEHVECELCDGSVGKGVVACNRDALNFTEPFPKGFDRIVWVPDGGNAGPIAFEFGTRDGAICGAQMCEHGSDGYVGEAKNVIVKSGEVDVIDRSKNLFFDLFLDSGGGGQFF